MKPVIFCDFNDRDEDGKVLLHLPRTLEDIKAADLRKGTYTAGCYVVIHDDYEECFATIDQENYEAPLKATMCSDLKRRKV